MRTAASLRAAVARDCPRCVQRAEKAADGVRDRARAAPSSLAFDAGAGRRVREKLRQIALVGAHGVRATTLRLSRRNCEKRLRDARSSIRHGLTIRAPSRLADATCERPSGRPRSRSAPAVEIGQRALRQRQLARQLAARRRAPAAP